MWWSARRVVNSPEWREGRKDGGMKELSVAPRKVCSFRSLMAAMRVVAGMARRAESCF